MVLAHLNSSRRYTHLLFGIVLWKLWYMEVSELNKTVPQYGTKVRLRLCFRKSNVASLLWHTVRHLSSPTHEREIAFSGFFKTRYFSLSVRRLNHCTTTRARSSTCVTVRLNWMVVVLAPLNDCYQAICKQPEYLDSKPTRCYLFLMSPNEVETRRAVCHSEGAAFDLRTDSVVAQDILQVVYLFGECIEYFMTIIVWAV